MERDKLRAVEETNEDYKATMLISQEVKRNIDWWIKAIPDSVRSFWQENYTKEIYTDASDLVTITVGEPQIE